MSLLNVWLFVVGFSLPSSHPIQHLGSLASIVYSVSVIRESISLFMITVGSADPQPNTRSKIDI